MKDDDDGLEFPYYVETLAPPEDRLQAEEVLRKKLNALKTILLWEEDAEICVLLMKISETWRLRRLAKREGWDVSVQVEAKKAKGLSS